jgi:hypothetical protein
MNMDEHYIYNYLFRNRLFELDQDLQNLQELFERLCVEKVNLLDRYGLIYTQIKLVRSGLSVLLSLLSRIDGDFKKTNS